MKAQIVEFNMWINEVDSEKLKLKFQKHLQTSGFQILGFLEHTFSPIGFTAVWILAESHLAIHTFPEEGKSYIQISSCNQEMLSNFQSQFEKKNKTK